jgi:cytochrome P450
MILIPSRRPRKDSFVPLSRPVLGIDGRMVDCIHVRAGTMVVVGAAAVNRDPIIWGPDADQWIPERWLRPLPETVHDAYLPGVYSNMLVLRNLTPGYEADLGRRMTFMGGGRSCM